MKKLLLSIIVIAVSAFTLTSQVNRNLVLVEIATGTGCPYCPGSAMGLSDLYNNGDPVAGIEYHSYNSGDPFNTPEAAARNAWYGVTGYPTAQFDGEYDEVVGGSNSSSMYSSYLPIVNTRIGMQSDFTVEIYGDNTGNNYNITVRVTKVGTYSGTDLKVRFALTETDIPYSWQGQSMVEYCERLMAPDENGTAVSFASGNTQDVNLTFTFDNTWVDYNCELIAWIQDDANKYVLNTESVMLLALQPDAANAGFTVSNDQPCEGSSVDFTDLSTGAITTWNWTFEGGTPSTSTDQNPTVTYSTQGAYDVTLYVSDGTTNSTLLIEDMIEVILPPVQPDIPTGDTDVCADGTYTYTTNPVAYADTYIWEVSPPDAGTLTSNGTEATFESSLTWNGSYTISVRADNTCGIGTWSTPLSCNLNITPASFLLSEGGGMCDGSPGIEITQDGSETGMNYDLYRDGTYTGTTVAGTGSPLSFGYQTDEGTYTVTGVAPMCDTQMWGTPWLYYIELPVQLDPPSGETTVCNSEITNYSVSIYDYADTVYWDLQPSEAGIVIGGEFEADIDWDDNFSGIATLGAQGVNQCGSGPASEVTEIVVGSSPNPEISGLTTVCDEDEEEYSVAEVSGNSYTWNVVGGEIISGAGSSSIIVRWGEAGTGSVMVTETSPNDCSGIVDDFTVTIEECVGINESLSVGDVLVYPNPASNNIHIVFNEKPMVKYNVRIYNSLGQIILASKGISDGGNQKIGFDISTLKQGYYIVNITSDSGLNIKTSFDKN